MTLEIVLYLLLFSLLMTILVYLLWYQKISNFNLKKYKALKSQKLEHYALLDNQGHCNLNYHLKTDKQEYVIRKFKQKTERRTEYFIQNLAYKKGVAAKPILLDEEKQLMVSDYIQGEHRFDLDRFTLKKLALVLHKLHKIKFQQRPTTFKKMFKHKHKKVYQAFRIIESFQPEYVLGHNDLHPKNILFGDKIKLIDWEHAGVTDRYYDLASIIIEFKMTTQEEKIFLNAYFQNRKSPNYKKLKAYKVIYKTIWSLWFSNLERGQINSES